MLRHTYPALDAHCSEFLAENYSIQYWCSAYGHCQCQVANPKRCEWLHGVCCTCSTRAGWPASIRLASGKMDGMDGMDGTCMISQGESPLTVRAAASLEPSAWPSSAHNPCLSVVSDAASQPYNGSHSSPEYFRPPTSTDMSNTDHHIPTYRLWPSYLAFAMSYASRHWHRPCLRRHHDRIWNSPRCHWTACPNMKLG